MNEADVEARLRAEVGRLTRLPPSEFVAGRTARAKELKAQGEAELARQLAGQRRPTVPAWAADQLAHRHAEELEALFDAADRVRAAQTAAPPERTAVREASTAFTGHVRRLRGLAGERLVEAGTTPDAHLDEVEATLLAAATDERIQADLRAGALLRPAPSPGFAALASLSSPGAPVPGPPASDAAATDTADGERDAQRAADRRAAELRAIQARRQELRTRHESCLAEARQAAERAASATSRAEELRAEAERLQHAISASEEEASGAERAAREAREVAAELAEQLAALDAQEAEVTAPVS